MRPRSAQIILLCQLCVVPLAHAAVTVINEVGPTRPLAPFLAVLGAPERRGDAQPTAIPADITTLLPIHSPGLSPGVFEARSIALPLTRPVFLIGADARSLDWLADHHDALAAVGAVGMLVQVETLAELAGVAEAAAGLPIQPASASDIANALKISTYPVLITRNRMEQ